MDKKMNATTVLRASTGLRMNKMMKTTLVTDIIRGMGFLVMGDLGSLLRIGGGTTTVILNSCSKEAAILLDILIVSMSVLGTSGFAHAACGQGIAETIPTFL